MPAIYRIFDTVFSCDFPLPELQPAANAEPSIAVQMGARSQLDTDGFETAFTWSAAGGQPICWCDRRGNEYLFVFPGYARYHVGGDGVIRCFLEPGADIAMLRHLLLNQVLPRYLASNGRLVVHASAVTLASGRTIAFLGNTGFGKSTLASSFHRHGADLVDDDSIMLCPAADGVTVLGGLPGIRLYPDSVQAVFSETLGFSRYTPYSDKQQMLLRSDRTGEAGRGRRLDALFMLNDPQSAQSVTSVAIEPAPGAAALMAMISCAFSLDPGDKQSVKRNFEQVGAAITPPLGLYSLAYPREHARLPEVRKAVTACLERLP